jgi:CheY-like chemotaxis protein
MVMQSLNYPNNQSFYSLILMDCQMPVLDGYSACKEIRELFAFKKDDQPLIIACTGNEDSEHIRRAWSCGMDETVSKPASIEVIS